jgi:hypothetical protein
MALSFSFFFFSSMTKRESQPEFLRFRGRCISRGVWESWVMVPVHSDILDVCTMLVEARSQSLFEQGLHLGYHVFGSSY